MLYVYLVITFLAHWVYGFGHRTACDYLGNRPENARLSGVTFGFEALLRIKCTLNEPLCEFRIGHRTLVFSTE